MRFVRVCWLTSVPTQLTVPEKAGESLPETTKVTLSGKYAGSMHATIRRLLLFE